MQARHAITQVFGALERHDAAAASALLAPLIERHPDDPNVQLAEAILMRLRGDFQASIEALRRLRARHPGTAAIALQLGASLESAGQHEPALREFAEGRSLGHAPSARAYAALCERTSAEAAGRAYVAANALDTGDVGSLRRALRCAARVELPEQPAPESISESSGTFSVIVCSRTPERLDRLARNLRQHLGPHEFLPAHDPPSVAAGYSAALERATGEFTILCHDDIRTLAPDFRQRLLAHLSTADVVGVAGSTRLAGPTVFWAGHPHVHGWIIQREGEEFCPGVSSGFGPTIQGARLLDGLFLAGRTSVLRSIGFDAVTFDGFHFYDMDFSCRAHAAGLSLAICPDLLIEHLSRGRFDAAWQRYAARFVAKFRVPERAPARAETAEIVVRTEREVVDLYRVFAQWTRPWPPAREPGAAED